MIYSLNACIESKIFKEIIVASDSKKYLEIIEERLKHNKNIIFFKRNKKNSQDSSSSENVILEIIKEKKIAKNTCALIQATSPLVSARDIINAFKKYETYKYDSLFSSYKTKKFLWSKKNKKLSSLNYNFKRRPMRQKNFGSYIENGAIYIFKSNNIEKYKNRLHRKIGTYCMSEDKSLEIDTKDDLNKLKILVNKNRLKTKIVKNFNIK